MFIFPLYTSGKTVYLDNTSISSIFCTDTDCFFPEKSLSDENIHITDGINWNRSENLVLHTKGNVVFEDKGEIVSESKASIILKSGMEPEKKEKYNSTVTFEGNSTQIKMLNDGEVKIYYNPTREENTEHKYYNPDNHFYSQHIKANNLTAYILVNDVRDLQDIRRSLSGDYALSQNINAEETKDWNNGKGFKPLIDRSKSEKGIPFSGNFDGNNYTIRNLVINRPEESAVGLFAECKGRSYLHNKIENLILENIVVGGDHYVGSLAGAAIYSDLTNIKIINPKIKSRDVAGGLVGTAVCMRASVQIIGAVEIRALENKVFAVVGGEEYQVTLLSKTKYESDTETLIQEEKWPFSYTVVALTVIMGGVIIYCIYY